MWTAGLYDESSVNLIFPKRVKLASKSKFQSIYVGLGIILFILGQYLAYEAAVSRIASPTQWNEGMAVAILITLVYYGGYEYLHL